MIRSIKFKLLLNCFILVVFLFMISGIDDHVQGQTMLEEQPEMAKEKIRHSKSQITQNTKPSQSDSNLLTISTQQQSPPKEWKTFMCSLCNLSFDYPPTVPGITQPDQDRFKKEHSVFFYDKSIDIFNIKYIVGTPNDNVTYEDIKKLRDWCWKEIAFTHPISL